MEGRIFVCKVFARTVLEMQMMLIRRYEAEEDITKVLEMLKVTVAKRNATIVERDAFITANVTAIPELQANAMG